MESARRSWRTPDQGIWEVRTPGRVFEYVAALCQVALDRGAKLAARYGLPGDIAGWRGEAGRVAAAILTAAWDPAIGSPTEHLGGGGLDAGLLALPLRRVVPLDHPRMVATTAAIAERLDAGGGLLSRYRSETSPDGLAGGEGACPLGSFWMVDNLVGQGRLDQAGARFGSICSGGNPSGLARAQIDPIGGAFLGNFPRGVGHIGPISNGVKLARASGGGA